AIVLFVPPAEHAIEWAACAVWLGLVWLTFALVWRERGAFSVFQIALSLAAVLCGVAWIHSEAPATSYFGPAAFHVYALALGLLGVSWAVTRRLLRANARARALWVEVPLSAERVILAAAVVGQLLLAAVAIIPEVQAQLTPSDLKYFRVFPTAF